MLSISATCTVAVRCCCSNAFRHRSTPAAEISRPCISNPCRLRARTWRPGPHPRSRTRWTPRPCMTGLRRTISGSGSLQLRVTYASSRHNLSQRAIGNLLTTQGSTCLLCPTMDVYGPKGCRPEGSYLGAYPWVHLIIEGASSVGLCHSSGRMVNKLTMPVCHATSISWTPHTWLAYKALHKTLALTGG